MDYNIPPCFYRVSVKALIQTQGIEKFILHDGNFWPYVAIQESQEIQALYDSVIGELKPLMHYDIEREYFFNPEEINDITLRWTMGHAMKKYGSTFQPHISIGIGDTNTTEYTRSFETKGIGVYQLGNYCTCRKELFSLTF